MVQTVAVAGAGTMGNGIAHVFAQAGFRVNLIDVHAHQLEKALQTISANLDRQVSNGTITSLQKEESISRIHLFASIEAGVRDADLVIEAITEKVQQKLALFRQIDQLTKPACILASNTSSISITKIAAVTSRPGKVIGMHFMNPVPVMKLIEIINGYATEAEVTTAVIELSKKLEKVPCVVHDYPGFISNRVLMPMINEAVYCLYEGVADVEAIDKIMKLGMAHPMGPLRLADFIGLDVCVSILKVLYEGLGKAHYVPCPLLVNMVEAGKLGVKSEEGFYIYDSAQRTSRVSEGFRLGNQLSDS